jgi:pyroglutamyl-peptidase
VATRPRLLVTGFGPFPNAPLNPTASLVETLLAAGPEGFGAGALEAVVLPSEYKRSWCMLRRLTRRFEPDVVVHFGLSRLADGLMVERQARRACDRGKPDASGFAPPSGRIGGSGPEMLPATLPVEAIVAALSDAGLAARASNDAGDYVCNATLYRSLRDAAPGRLVGFVHVPPEGSNGFSAPVLHRAAALILRTALECYRP